jgi:hypothetical protein
MGEIPVFFKAHLGMIRDHAPQQLRAHFIQYSAGMLDAVQQDPVFEICAVAEDMNIRVFVDGVDFHAGDICDPGGPEGFGRKTGYPFPVCGGWADVR